MTHPGKEALSLIVEGLEGVTPGIWNPCHHLKSPEHDASCGCGYHGSIWSGDGEYIILEMGSSPDVDETGRIVGHIQPQAERPTQLADAAHIIRCSPDTIRSIAAAFEEVERERDELEKKLGATDAALSLCGYGADTHAGMLAGMQAAVKLAKERGQLVETLTRQRDEAREALKTRRSETDVTNWQELSKIGCETAQGFGLSLDLEKLLGLDIAHELEDVANAAWEQGRSAALAAAPAVLVGEKDEIDRLTDLAYCHTSKGPMLWKDAWQGEVDQQEWYRSSLNPIWDQVRLSERNIVLERAARILETYPLAKVPPQNMSWFGEIIDTIRALKSEEPK